MRIGWHPKKEWKTIQESKRVVTEPLHFREHCKGLGTFLRKLIDTGDNDRADDQMPLHCKRPVLYRSIRPCRRGPRLQNCICCHGGQERRGRGLAHDLARYHYACRASHHFQGPRCHLNCKSILPRFAYHANAPVKPSHNPRSCHIAISSFHSPHQACSIQCHPLDMLRWCTHGCMCTSRQVKHISYILGFGRKFIRWNQRSH